MVEAPTLLSINAMQIDTWNRDHMNITGKVPPAFVSGPVPKSSLAPLDAEYSGLLECPVTTRITRDVIGNYNVETSDRPQCNEYPENKINSDKECYQAAYQTLTTHSPLQVFHNATGASTDKPVGCSVTTNAAPASSPASSPASPVPWVVHVYFNTLNTSTTTCASNPSGHLMGTAIVDAVGTRVQVVLDKATKLATITLTGPRTKWFGVGFNATAMASRPWTLVVQTHPKNGSTFVTERKLGGPSPNDHVPGDVLPPSVTVQSITTVGAQRVVVVTRPLVGLGHEYYTFAMEGGDPLIPIITASGSAPTLSYHQFKDPSSLTLLPVRLPGAPAGGACVCPTKPPAFGQALGALEYHRVLNQTYDTGTGSVAFGGYKVCKPFPATVLLEQKNPTCDVRYYKGW